MYIKGVDKVQSEAGLREVMLYQANFTKIFANFFCEVSHRNRKFTFVLKRTEEAADTSAEMVTVL